MLNYLNKYTIGWFFVSLLYAYQYVLRVLPIVLKSTLISAFHLSAFDIGQFSGLFYIGYAAAHIPCGLMLDRMDARFVVIPSAIMMATSVLPFLVGPSSIYLLNIGRILMGIGAAGVALAMIKVAQTYFPASILPRMIGISITIGLIGGMYGEMPLQILLNAVGFESVTHILIVVPLALACVTYFTCVAKDDVNKTTSADQHQRLTLSGILKNMRFVLCDKQLLLAALCGGLMIGPLEGFGDAWSVTFLKSLYPGIDSNFAAFASSLILFGMCFGLIGIPILMQKFSEIKNLNWVSYLCISNIISFSAILLLPIGPIITAAMMFLVGIISAYQVCILTFTVERFKADSGGLAVSGLNMIMMSFGYIFHSAIGGILDFIAPAAQAYSYHQMAIALSIIPIASVLAMFVLIILNKAIKKESKAQARPSMQKVQFN